MSERENHERDPREMEPDYLVELALQLHARACNPACSEALHDRANELKRELERRCERARIAEQEKRGLVRGLQAIADYGSDERGLHIDDFEAKYPEFIDMEQDEIARALLAKDEAEKP